MDWSPEQVADLRRLWVDAKMPASEIGRQLGISKNAVVGKAHRLHLPSRESPIKRSAGGPRVYQRYVARHPLDAPKAPVAVPRAKPVYVAPLSKEQCSWPVGHPGEEGFKFCTDKALVGKPYCAEHCGHAYARVKAPDHAPA